MSKPVITIHTDGACSGNPGPGGWAAILSCQGKNKIVTGSDPATTNNQMELMAVLGGLGAITKPCEVVVVTDSQNVIGWLSQGWKRNNLAIRALCVQIEEVIGAKGLTISFQKVAGHSGDDANELADSLAVAAIPR